MSVWNDEQAKVIDDMQRQLANQDQHISDLNSELEAARSRIETLTDRANGVESLAEENRGNLGNETADRERDVNELRKEIERLDHRIDHG